MANTTSAKKAVRVSERRRSVNTRVSNSFKQARKAVTDAISAGDVKTAKSSLPKAYSQIDMAAKKGVIHKNTASRYKSRLSAKVKSAEATA
ncbi:MAG: 30S ribosomal protein S20 [Candidatus Dojkabacteria bacterium]|uniref:Small ribosomal subunit protein bS20 n=1 Tax=Candidatus Dojkabacteria bacterium TaxID=2099670 RepID=A0A952DVG8_9BACT|nr:30S ribosomal protein S20 [Candidatus Dojkabacteria bacterium]WKZ28219.1 MAG: 30S ribosomal protein S20 [Candidatus Dojkabacteria bacterium]